MIFWHPHHINIYKPGKDLRRLFASGILRQTSIGLISLFSSLYIFDLFTSRGYESRLGVIAVLLFHCVVFIFKFIVFFIAENYSYKKGFKSSIAMSLPPFFLFIFSLILVERYLYMLFVAGIFWGVSAAFYWWGYHGYFIKSTKDSVYGKSIGEMDFLKTIAAIAIPVSGSVIAVGSGYASLFIISAMIMTFSILVLYGSEEKKQTHDTTVKNLLVNINKNKAVFMSYVSVGVEGGFYTSLWPLFLYLFFENILEMGSIISVSIALAAFFAIIIGGIEDRKGEKGLISIGTPMITASWLIKTFLAGPFAYITADSLWNFGQKLVYLPLDALSYKKSANGNTANAILFREIGLNTGALFGYLLMAAIYFFTESFYLLFIVAGIFSFIPAIALALGGFDDKKK